RKNRKEFADAAASSQGRLRVFAPLPHPPGGRRSGAARAVAWADAPVSRQTKNVKAFGTHRAATRALPPSSGSVPSLSPLRLVLSRCRSSEEQNKPETARKGKTM